MNIDSELNFCCSICCYILPSLVLFVGFLPLIPLFFMNLLPPTLEAFLQTFNINMKYPWKNLKAFYLKSIKNVEIISNK